MTDRSVSARSAGLSIFCREYWFFAIRSNPLQWRSLERNMALLKSVKLRFALLLCARQHNRDTRTLKRVPSACAFVPVLSEQRTSFYRMAATAAHLLDSAQPIRSVLPASNRTKALKLMSSLPSKLTAVKKELLASATCYRDYGRIRP